MHPQELSARRVNRSVLRGGLRAYEATYAPGSRLPEHEHSLPFFTYVLRGDYIEQIGASAQQCERGTIMFHGRCESHANVVGTRGTASLNVELSENAWTEITEDSIQKKDMIGKIMSGDLEWIALTVWREFHTDDAASALRLEEAVSLLCASLHTSSAHEERIAQSRLDVCLEYIKAHETNVPKLADVARVAHVHPMHVAKLFRRQFGYSMGEFVRRQRIKWACEQLTRDTGTISMIAVAAGFADHAHFTRTFRRVTGCSPQWYRQRINTTVPGF